MRRPTSAVSVGWTRTAIAAAAPALSARAQDEVELGQVRCLRGAIVKESADQVFVDVGPTIVALPRASVVALRRGAATATARR